MLKLHKPVLTQAELKSHLHYDKTTGVFTWLKHRHANKVGTVAGAIKKDTGYAILSIAGTQYYCHRLAYLYVHGHFPAKCVDHKNGDRSANQFKNLRPATRGQNHQNIKKAFKSNKSTGILGVYLQRGKYVARITHNQKTYNLGSFSEIALASMAYRFAKRQIHEYGTL